MTRFAQVGQAILRVMLLAVIVAFGGTQRAAATDPEGFCDFWTIGVKEYHCHSNEPNPPEPVEYFAECWVCEEGGWSAGSGSMSCGTGEEGYECCAITQWANCILERP